MAGLFTGFSLISGLEIIYWLWFKVLFHRKDAEVSPVSPSSVINVGENSDEMKILVKELRSKLGDLEAKVERLERHKHKHKHHHGHVYDAEEDE